MSSSSSSDTDSVALEPHRYYIDSLRKSTKEPSKWTWALITSIALTVIGALIAALAVLSMHGTLPTGLLGGTVGTGMTFAAGFAILVPSALATYHYWYQK